LTARGDHSEAQQARSASSTAAVPRTLSSVSCWPAKLDPAESSSTALERTALAKGFLMVSASPMTRSSYHAGEDFARLRAARLAAGR